MKWKSHRQLDGCWDHSLRHRTLENSELELSLPMNLVISITCWLDISKSSRSSSDIKFCNLARCLTRALWQCSCHEWFCLSTFTPLVLFYHIEMNPGGGMPNVPCRRLLEVKHRTFYMLDKYSIPELHPCLQEKRDCNQIFSLPIFFVKIEGGRSPEERDNQFMFYGDQ